MSQSGKAGKSKDKPETKETQAVSQEDFKKLEKRLTDSIEESKKSNEEMKQMMQASDKRQEERMQASEMRLMQAMRDIIQENNKQSQEAIAENC